MLDVNGWHNVVHLATGLLGLAFAGSYDGSCRFAIGLGVVYSLVTVMGLLYGSDDAILGLVPINAEDNVLHALIALAGLAAWAATPSAPRPTVGAGRAGVQQALALQAATGVARHLAHALGEGVHAMRLAAAGASAARGRG